MILGAGIDLIEVDRIRNAMTRHGERFARRFLLPDELAYCQSHRDPAPFVAARFAAKEAASKAFGTGIGAALGWLDLEVRRRESGQPYFVLHGRGARLFAERNATALHLSLSHTAQHASAVAILEGPQTGREVRPEPPDARN
jgi:holo-[acyl-carrier protein] synthase